MCTLAQSKIILPLKSNQINKSFFFVFFIAKHRDGIQISPGVEANQRRRCAGRGSSFFLHFACLYCRCIGNAFIVRQDLM